MLEYVLGDHLTIPADRGVFLSETWRMHPDVCEFISEQIYEGRLTSHLNSRAKTVDEMQLIATLCSFVEHASPRIEPSATGTASQPGIELPLPA